MRPLEQCAVVITGATSGLGRHVAQRVAQTGARVLVHGRDRRKVDRTTGEIRAATGNERVEGVVADLAELTRVDRLATELTDRLERLDVLVNNAGVGFGPPGAQRELSADGFELRLAVNYLAGYRLTRGLVPLLIASAPARVVNVASGSQDPIDFDDPMLERGYDGATAYKRSKLAQIMFTVDLAEELEPHGVTVNAVHPSSVMDTPMVRQARWEPLSTVEEGGAATLRLITDPALDGVTGHYFDRHERARALEQAYDPEARQRLRELTDRLGAVRQHQAGGKAD